MSAQCIDDSINDDSMFIMEAPDDWYEDVVLAPTQRVEGSDAFSAIVNVNDDSVPDDSSSEGSGWQTALPPLTVRSDTSSDDNEDAEPSPHLLDEVLRKRKLGSADQFAGLSLQPLKRLRDKTVRYCGLPVHVMVVLLHLCLPWQTFHIIAMMFHEQMLDSDAVNLDCVEYFCGLGMVHKSLLARGYNIRGYDIAHGPDQDLNSSSGWVTALLWCLRIKSGTGLSWLGTVCSSWITALLWCQPAR